jgi:hypothetical protein
VPNDRSSNIISRFLDTVGDGSGSNDAATNAVALTSYRIAPPSGTTYVLTRMIVTVQDDSGMTATEYGNIGESLTNGIHVRVAVGADTNYTLTDPSVPIVSNAEWGSYCYDVAFHSPGGASPTDDVLLSRWTFAKSDRPVVLVGEDSEALEVLLHDDVSDLAAHRFLVQGYWYSTEARKHRSFNTPNFPDP